MWKQNQVNAGGMYSRYGNTGSGNSSATSGKKPLAWLMLTHIFVDIYRRLATVILPIIEKVVKIDIEC